MYKEIKFYKMQASGNDFIVLEKRPLSKEDIIKLCDRHYGIGCDQLIMIEDFSNMQVTVFNQDGSQAGNCGNGLRALGLLNYLLTDKETLNLRLDSRQMQVKIVQLLDKYRALVKAFLGNFTVKSLEKGITECFLGNKHIIIDKRIKPDIDLKEISTKYDANVTSFSQESSLVKARVYERGAGETGACGSAAAALFVAIGAKKEITVLFEKSGEKVRAGLVDGQLYLIGEAELVYQGNFYLKNDYKIFD